MSFLQQACAALKQVSAPGPPEQLTGCCGAAAGRHWPLGELTNRTLKQRWPRSLLFLTGILFLRLATMPRNRL
jgi:hypothetical protein